jgi:hypothetical protein
VTAVTARHDQLINYCGMLAYRRNVRHHHNPPTFDVGKERDAVISFECDSGAVKVVETIEGEKIRSRVAPTERDVVSELEKKYIFFADEAEIARKLIRRGRSCVLSVYFREP